MKNGAAHAGPRKCRMPPMIDMARISPEKVDVDRIGRDEELQQGVEAAGEPVNAAETTKAMSL